MNFWKKLFAGMGFVCGFLVFETMSLAYHNSRRRHKNRKGRCRRNSFFQKFIPRTSRSVFCGELF
jgi:hypothetical protein